jgi:hypothetical protein
LADSDFLDFGGDVPLLVSGAEMNRQPESNKT